MMEPAYKLPKNYRIEARFDLVKDKRAINVMKDIGTYVYLAIAIIPYSHLFITAHNPWITASLLLASFLVIASPSSWGLRLMGDIHLLIDSGIVWFWTRQRPLSQSQPPYLCLDLTDLYFSRKQYLIRMLIPLGMTTTTALTLLPFVPPAVATILLFMLAFGTAGSTVQMILASYVWFQPPEALVKSAKLVTTVYVPRKAVISPSTSTKPNPVLVEEQPKEKTVANNPILDDWFDIPLLKKSEKHLFLTTIKDEQTP